MKIARIALFSLTASAAILMAQDEATFQTWMKSVGTAQGALRKMEKKTGPDAVAHAEKIGSVYENQIAFWRQRNAEDAVKASMDGKAAAADLASAANAGDAEKASQALSKLNGTCKSCHEAHREKIGENKYKIK
jgi:cytochrome c556